MDDVSFAITPGIRTLGYIYMASAMVMPLNDLFIFIPQSQLTELDGVTKPELDWDGFKRVLST